MDREIEQALVAANMAAMALLTSLAQTLVNKGVLTSIEGREVFEHALLMIETAQGAAPASQDAFLLARKMIEDHLSAPGK